MLITSRKETCILISAESCKLEVLGTRDFILNYPKFDLQGGRHYIYPPKNDYHFFLSNICFAYVQEMSQGDVSFTHTTCDFIDSI